MGFVRQLVRFDTEFHMALSIVLNTPENAKDANMLNTNQHKNMIQTINVVFGFQVIFIRL